MIEWNWRAPNTSRGIPTNRIRGANAGEGCNICRFAGKVVGARRNAFTVRL